MEFLETLIDLVLHLDNHLEQIIDAYGSWAYPLLFAIIFLETGLVVTPFLPGDSLLFVAGAFAGTGALNLWLLFLSLTIAAIIGDTVNYWIGHRVGLVIFDGRIPFLKKAYLERTQEFYERHGGKTIILARFVPIVRTFAPFVAGVGTMAYGRFLSYNVIGGVAWVAIFLVAGYFFGSLPIVEEHLSLIILGVILVSVLPMVIEVLRERRRQLSVSSEQ